MKRKRLAIFALGFLMSGILFPGLQNTWDKALAESNQSKNGTDQGSKKVPEWIRPTSFQYSSKKKPDPFESFIKKEAISPKVSSGEKEKKKEKLTPLSSVEPSQVQLVGILEKYDKDHNAYGLVQLPNGKGYIINKGTIIGQKGAKVVSIKSDKVIIHQNYTTLTGDSKTEKIILNLHKTKEGNNE